MKIFVNGQEADHPDGTTISALLSLLGASPQRVVVEINLDVVPRDRFPTRQLMEGDRVEVVSFMAGG